MGGDCIGSTVYSKHWLFGVLSGLIQVWKFASLVGSPYFPPVSGPASGSPPGPARAVSTAPPPAPTPAPGRARQDLERGGPCSSPDPELPPPLLEPLVAGGGLAAGTLVRLPLKRFYFCRFSEKYMTVLIHWLGFFSPHSHGRFRSLSPNLYSVGFCCSRKKW